MDTKQLIINTAETIISNNDTDGYHIEMKKHWSYVYGLVHLALLHAWEITGDDKYYNYVKKHIDLYVLPDGSIDKYSLEEYNLDSINEGKILFPLLEQTGEDRFAKAAHLLAMQLKGQPRTSEGGFWHKKIYHFQMWLDGLYMASPFLAQYAKTFNRDDLFDDVANQILLAEKNTRDKKTGLLYHGWDESCEQEWCDPATGKSQHFWGRAMGWYAMAVVDVLDFLPRDHVKRGTIAGIFERMICALEKVQDDETGLWYQVLDQGKRKGNYLEASGSSMFVYAIAKAVRMGYIHDGFGEVALKGYDGLINNLVEVNDTGVHLHQICRGAGLGNMPYRDGSYTYYINEKIESDCLIGIAPFLMASIEIEKLQ